jgi:predicted ATPase/DNA-binding SARP family transcriptional activator
MNRFGVLGPLVFERDGDPVLLPSGRQRSLLALLLLGGGVPLSRDRLIDELWGERPPASAVSALHVHLSKLRELLGGLLVLGTAGYALRPGDFEVDVWSFDALVEEARADPEQAGVLLREALALFRGDPLCDVASEGSVAQWRRALDDKRLQAMMLRVDADLAGGAAGELVAELQQLVGEHPFEERLWSQLMLALYRAGRQADALDAFQRARRLLAVELGLEPGEPLARLQQRILDQDATLRQDAAAPSPLTSRAIIASNLPRPLTRLVGRERELSGLTGRLADPDVRLLTLSGPGGVGKTRLLLALARQEEPNYADGAAFVRLEGLTDPALVAAEIATTLAQREGSEALSADGLTRYLRERELLLALDNFEHLLPATGLVTELLERAPRIRVLITSRTPLQVRGEQVFDVEPLALPAGASDEEIARSPAVELFVHCALAANRRLEIDAAVNRASGAICRALDGLPLAIELAASRLRSLSTAQIEQQLARPLLIGGHSLRDLPDRQQTLEATMKWSYDLLTPSAQTVLRAAGAFLGGFTLEALEAVTGRSVPSELDELVQASLIRRQADGERFELLELVRAFARDMLEGCGEGSVLAARHRGYFADRVAPASQSFDDGAAPGEVAAPLLADHANVRAALEDAVHSGDQDAVARLALGLRPVWLAGMLRQEAQELVARVLDDVAVPGDVEIALLRSVGFLEGFTPEFSAWNRRLAKRAGELGDLDALATATGNQFGRALNARDRDEMSRLRPGLLASIAPESSPKALGWTHYFLALDSYVDGRFDAAFEHASLSAERAAAVGHDFMLASAVGTRLLAESARDGVIRQPALAETIDCMRRPSIAPLAAFALWLVARYAAGFAPETATAWLAHAERTLVAAGAELWPESVLRDETMAVLGLTGLDAALESTPPLDHVVALAQAALWLSERDGAEQAPRVVAPELAST